MAPQPRARTPILALAALAALLSQAHGPIRALSIAFAMWATRGSLGRTRVTKRMAPPEANLDMLVNPTMREDEDRYVIQNVPLRGKEALKAAGLVREDMDQSESQLQFLRKAGDKPSRKEEPDLEMPQVLPSRMVTKETDTLKTANEVKKLLMHSPVVELVLGRDSASKVHALRILMQLGDMVPISAKHAPRRRDMKSRLHIVAGKFESQREGMRTVRINSNTNITQIVNSLHLVLRGGRRQGDFVEGEKVQLQYVGFESGAKVMELLEDLRFFSRSDIRYTVTRNADSIATNVDMAIFKSTAILHEGDREDPNEKFSALPMPEHVNMQTYPTYRVNPEPSKRWDILPKRLTAALAVASNRMLDLVLASGSGESAGSMFAAVARLPPSLEVAAQIAPRHSNHKMRLRLIRNYPRPNVPIQEMRVSGTTDEKQLAKSMAVTLLPRLGSSAKAVEVNTVGIDSARKVLFALDHLQAWTKREITCWASRDAVTGSKTGELLQRIKILVMTT